MRDKCDYNAFRINHNATLKPSFLDVYDTKKNPSSDFSEEGLLISNYLISYVCIRVRFL